MIRKRTATIIFCAITAAMICSTIVDAQERRPRYPNREPAQDEEEEARARRTTPPAQLPDERRKVEFDVRYWFTSPRLSARVADTIDGTAVNGTAGIDLDSTNMPEPRFSGYITRSNKIRVDYLKMSAQGNAGDLSVQVPGFDSVLGLDDLDIDDSLATAKLDIQQLRVGYAWQGLNINNKVKVGPLVEVRGYKLNGSVTAPSLLATTASGEYYLGMVTAGVDIKIAPTPWMEVDSVISGIHLGGLGRIVDADVAGKYFFHKNVAVQGGYRFLRLRVDDGPNQAELRIRGPFVGVGFRF